MGVDSTFKGHYLMRFPSFPPSASVCFAMSPASIPSRVASCPSSSCSTCPFPPTKMCSCYLQRRCYAKASGPQPLRLPVAPRLRSWECPTPPPRFKNPHEGTQHGFIRSALCCSEEHCPHEVSIINTAPPGKIPESCCVLDHAFEARSLLCEVSFWRNRVGTALPSPTGTRGSCTQRPLDRDAK